MRIACLQFAPQVGDVDNNLNRADSVMSKADPDDLKDLDLLVLPELAFSGTSLTERDSMAGHELDAAFVANVYTSRADSLAGYDFKSLRQIAPFLEPSGSGISSLWARTTALRYNTTVVVGYPEKVDVTPTWPTSPEYYNSAIVVNQDGQTIGNYRKSFLYRTDETWALEGRDGFFQGEIPGLGQTVMGICMDLNPYRFEAPWHAFEFAFHILNVRANLVILSMAWSTHEDARMFSRMPAEPDMDTLTYWVQRLEPLIRAENDEETIVVFCNRTGKEGSVVYAGTSAVLSIKQGEVAVYGILGRGVKDLLVVDTDAAPFAKLVHRPEDEVTDAEVKAMPAQHTDPAHARSRTRDDTQDAPASDEARKPTPTPSTTGRSVKHKIPKPIQIPESPYRRLPSGTHATPIEESPTIATPTAPSPTPFSQRPRVNMPTKEQVNTPYPQYDQTQRYRNILGEVHSLVEPYPPPNPPISGETSEKYFWLPPQPIFRSPLEANYPLRPPVSPNVPSSLIRLPGENRNSMKTLPHPERAFSQDADRPCSSSMDESIHQSNIRAQSLNNSSDKSKDGIAPVRPSSPKSRKASRNGRPIERRASEVEQPDLSDMIDRLEAFGRRPGSALDDHYDPVQESRQGRPRTPKARPESRTGKPHIATRPLDDRTLRGSQGTVPLTASSSVFSETTARSKPDVSIGNRGSNRKTGGTGTIRPCPQAGARSRNRSTAAPDMDHSRSRSGSATQILSDHVAYIEPDETRTMVWSELSKIVGEVLDLPGSRNANRGSQRIASRSTSANPPVAVRATQSEIRAIHSAPHSGRRAVSQDRHGGIRSQPLGSAVSRNTASGVTTGPTSPYNPDDEIVAEIIFHDRGCPTHSQRQAPGTGTGTGNPTPSQTTNPTSPPAMTQRINSRPSHERSSRASQRSEMPQIPRKESFSRKPVGGPSPSRQPARGEKGNFQARALLSTMSRFNSNESCPTMDGSSVHTLATPKSSPATPPPRFFEPTTPKAMKLDPDLGTVLTSSSDPASGAGGFPPMDALRNERLGIGLARPRSAVW